MRKPYPCVIGANRVFHPAFGNIETAIAELHKRTRAYPEGGPYTLGVIYRYDNCRWDTKGTPMNEDDLRILLSTEEEW